MMTMMIFLWTIVVFNVYVRDKCIAPLRCAANFKLIMLNNKYDLFGAVTLSVIPDNVVAKDVKPTNIGDERHTCAHIN